jgi:hypothetical protein
MACGRHGHGNCYGDGSGPVEVLCEYVCESKAAYVNDRNSYQILMEELARRNLQLVYADYLLEIVHPGRYVDIGQKHEWDIFRILQVTQDQICKAFLLAMGVKVE